MNDEERIVQLSATVHNKDVALNAYRIEVYRLRGLIAAALEVCRDMEQDLDSEHVAGEIRQILEPWRDDDATMLSSSGAGYVRLIVGPGPTVEYCFKCGCKKSGWVNMENEIGNQCEHPVCICHTAERVR